MRCWLLLLLCGTAVSALSHDSAGKPPPMSKLKFQQKFQKSFVQPLGSSDFAMDQLKDTLKEIQGSVDTALSQRLEAKVASDKRVSELETSVTSLESAKRVVVDEVEEFKNENAELKDKKRKLKDQLEPLQDENAQMQTKIDQLEQELEERQVDLDQSDLALKVECDMFKGCVFHAKSNGESACIPSGSLLQKKGDSQFVEEEPCGKSYCPPVKKVPSSKGDSGTKGVYYGSKKAPEKKAPEKKVLSPKGDSDLKEDSGTKGPTIQEKGVYYGSKKVSSSKKKVSSSKGDSGSKEDTQPVIDVCPKK